MQENSEQAMSPLSNNPQQPATYYFIDALKEVMNGARITKAEWGDQNVYGLLRDGILMIHGVKGEDVYSQWILSEADMLGDDWIILSEEN